MLLYDLSTISVAWCNYYTWRYFIALIIVMRNIFYGKFL